jgi:hypothetical protein
MGDCPVLNFDPHRWLADREGAESVATVATVATVARARADFEISISVDGPATVATTATKPARNPSIILRDWHSHLAPMNADAAPAGFTRQRWRELHGDSWWIYENYASRAVRDGWSALDLFGVLPSRPGWGGLCDRLQGARNLKMAGPKAIWSNGTVPDSLCIGAGEALAPSGLVPIWALQREGESMAAQ